MSRCRSYMSVLERQKKEVASYIAAWENTLPEQLAEELASLSLETKRIPDPYSFLITDDGELFSPTANKKIKDSVEDKLSRLGNLEYQAVVSIEKWAAQSDEGAAVWLSPPLEGVYPTAKIIISEIQLSGGIKRLFNRALVFDFSEKECFELACNLANFSQNQPDFTNLDQVRSTPFILRKGAKWMNILEELIDDSLLWENVKRGKDKKAKKDALRQATTIQKQFFSRGILLRPDEAVMAVIQMLGSKAGSCPPGQSTKLKTGAVVFSENSTTYTGAIKDPDFCRSCPVCGEEIKCIVRVGGSCPKCGAVKRCG